MLKITAEEVNILIYQYLQETNYPHSAFTFQLEAKIQKNSINFKKAPPGLLLVFLEKALLLMQMETHLDKDEELTVCNQPFTLLNPHICAYINQNIEEDKPHSGGIIPRTGSYAGENQPLVELPLLSKAFSINPIPIAQPQNVPTINKEQINPPIEMKTDTAEIPQPEIKKTEQMTDIPQKQPDPPPKLSPIIPILPISFQNPISVGNSMGNSIGTESPIKGNKIISSFLDSSMPISVPMISKEENTKPTAAILDVPLMPPIQKGIYRLEGHRGLIYALAWHPTKSILASGGSDSTARLWRLDNSATNPEIAGMHLKDTRSFPHPAPKTTISLPHIHELDDSLDQKNVDITSLSWNNKSNLLLTGAQDGYARVWDDSGNILAMMKMGDEIIMAAKWNKSGSYILTTGNYNKFVVWDSTNWKEVRVEEAHSQLIYDADWKNDKEFATASADSLIKLWDLSVPGPQKVFKGHLAPVLQVKWDPVGSILASCSEDHTAKLWIPLKGEEPVFSLNEHSQVVENIRWSPSGTGTSNPNIPLMLATGSSDTTIKLWDIATGKCFETIREHKNEVSSLAFSGNCEYLASGGNDSMVEVYSLRNHRVVKRINMAGIVLDVAWSPDSQMIAAASSNDIILLDLRYL